MGISVAFHLIGLVMWVGSLLVVTRYLKLFSEQRSGSSDLAALQSMTKRVFWGFGIGGLVVVLVSGLYQISVAGVSFYLAQPWFHTKLTFVLILFILTVVVGMQVNRAAGGEGVKARTVGMLHGLVSLVLLITVLTSVLGSGRFN